nr:acyl-CoA dehydrogenase [Cytophagales bacterium]
MMISEKVYTLVDRYRGFLTDHVYGLEKEVVYGSFKRFLPELKELRKKARDYGLFAPHLPVSAGGLGLTLVEFAHVSEVLGRSPIGHYVFNCQAPDIGNMELMSQYASDQLKTDYLIPLQRGDIRSCFAMTEPAHAGSNPVYLSTSAIRQGDHFVINGHKWFTTGADGASFVIVMAVTDPDNPNPYQRASMLLVPMDTPGCKLLRNIPIMGDVGEDYLSHGEVVFKDCKVPETNLIGSAGEGFALAQERLGPGRIHHCMRWLGICERALEMMCQRALARELSPGKALATQQTIENWIAESAAEIRASRLMVLDTARIIQDDGAKAAKADISTIKFFVSDVLMKIIDRAVQVHGALGISDDTLLSFWYRHERGARIYDGPDEVHKSVLARKILRTYAS